MEKLKAFFKHSVTILWARIVTLSGLVAALLTALINDPSISSAIQQILNPEYVPYYIIAIGIITEIARWRTAGK